MFITDGGLPQHVLMGIEEYLRLVGGRRIVDVLAMPAFEAIAFDPSKAEITMVCSDSDWTSVWPYRRMVLGTNRSKTIIKSTG